MNKCATCPMTGECVAVDYLCQQHADNPERWAAAIASHTRQQRTRRRAGKRRVALGVAHCEPCKQTAAGPAVPPAVNAAISK